MHAGGAQEQLLVGGLHAFRRYLHAQAAAEADHRVHDGRGIGGFFDGEHEAAVDLELVERQAAQIEIIREREPSARAAVGRARDRDMGGAQRGRPALAQVLEIGLAGLDAVVHFGGCRLSRRATRISIGSPTPRFERMVESIEISPILSAS